MQGMQAYGAGKAGGAFDPLTFFQQPQTILRIVCWVSGHVYLSMSLFKLFKSGGHGHLCTAKYLQTFEKCVGFKSKPIDCLGINLLTP